MGKKGSSWFRAVKRAFGSPSKDCDSKRCRRYHSSSIAEAEQVSVAKKEKEKEKRKWVFGKSAYFEDHQEKSSSDNKEEKEKEKHGITVVSSSCEADIGVARPSTSWAAIRIQTAFRAYLARRALRALRGLVRLQALVRGYNVRKQTNATLRCMEALVRVQLRVRDGRLLQVQVQAQAQAQAHQQEAMDRKSLSHSRDSQQHWDDRTHIHTAEKQSKEAAAAKRERALAYAFSHQLRKSGGKEGASSFLDKGQGQGQGHWGWSWLDRWMAARPWETTSVEKDCKSANDVAIKTVQVDRCRGRGRGSSYSQPHEYASPAHHSPASASTAPAPRRSSSPSHSPRSCGRHSIYNQEIFFPRLGSRRTSNINDDFNSIANSAAVPNYMAATESARAKARSQSAPRQRAGTPEKERWPTCVKKRLSFPAPDANNTSTSTMHQKSPSLKGIPGPIKIERSNLSFTQSSNGGETTPSSIGNLRKWLG